MKKYILASLLAVGVSTQVRAAENTKSVLTGTQLYQLILPKFALRYGISLVSVAAGGYLLHKGVNEQKNWKIAAGVLGILGGGYFGLRSAFDQGYVSCMAEVWDIFLPQTGQPAR